MSTAMTIRAVYRGGALCPDQPLPFAEGAVIDVTISPHPTESSPRTQHIGEIEEYAARVRAAQSLQELHAAMAKAPPGDGKDIVEAINASRRETGFRMPDPAVSEEMPR